MKKLVLTLAAALLGFLVVDAQDGGKFAFLTDTHIAEGAQSIIELEACIEDINADSSIGFAIFGGDITEFGSDKEIALAKSIIDKLEKPYYVVAGNHDAKWSESGCNTFAKVFGYEHFAIEQFGVKIVASNSGPNMRMAPALVPRESIVWLDSLVKSTPAQMPLIFVNHYPMDSSVLNFFEVVDILKESNVQMCIGGHWHKNIILDYEGIPGVLCRSSMEKGTKGAGYTVFSIADGKISAHEKIADGEAMEPWFTLEMSKPEPFKNRSTVVGKRTDYTANEKYPQIQEQWSLRETSDIGAGAVAKGDRIVYTTATGYVKCISLENGSLLWSVKTGGKVYSTPAIAGSSVVVGSTDGIIYCFDIKDGSLLWRHHCDKSVLGTATIFRDMVSGYTVFIGASDGNFRALSLKDGKLKWNYSGMRGFVESKPYVDKKQVVIGDWANTLYSLDTKTGKLQWKWRTSGSRMYSPAAVWPIKGNKRLYIVTPKRKTYAIEANSGNTVWEHNGGRESIGVSPEGDRVFVKTMNDTVLCFAANMERQPTLLWRADARIGYDIAPTPIMCDIPDRKTPDEGLVFIPTDKGDIVALKAKDGSFVWKYKFSYALINSIQPLDGRKLLVCSMDGKVAVLTY